MSQQPQKQTTTPSEFGNGFNVHDDLKGLTAEQIKMEVQLNAFPSAVLMTQIQGDFNFSSVVRNANAFGFSKVFYIGPSKKWDKRGAVGTYHYTDVEYLGDAGGDNLWPVDHYTWVALENNVSIGKKIHTLYEFDWPENTLLIVGEEGTGVPESILQSCEYLVTIPQYGSVRSINAATAAGIAMNAYAQQHSKV